MFVQGGEGEEVLDQGGRVGGGVDVGGDVEGGEEEEDEGVCVAVGGEAVFVCCARARVSKVRRFERGKYGEAYRVR